MAVGLRGGLFEKSTEVTLDSWNVTYNMGYYDADRLNNGKVPEGEYNSWVCPFSGSVVYGMSCEGRGAAGALGVKARQYRNNVLIYESDEFSHRGSGTSNNSFAIYNIQPGDRLCLYMKGNIMKIISVSVYWRFL